MTRRPHRLACALVMAALTAAPALAQELPPGFAYLARIDPTIVQDMRYAGVDNFTGARVPGYEAGECVLAEPVARALSGVQRRLAASGRTLIVFDCYRPASAVRAFVDWSKKGDPPFDPRYHPRVARKRLIAEGYIAARSGHSSGGSVDLTFGVRDAAGKVEPAQMGGGFDLFDPASHTQSHLVDAPARANRRFLADAMTAEGFANYPREWWHFRHSDEPFAGRIFDFPVIARKR